MSIVGESILSVSIELLIEKLASEGLRLFARQEKIEADLLKWKKILVRIKAVLEDADDKQTREKSVKMWIDDLQNLAYDVEDILDEFETETHRSKLLRELQDQPSTSKLRKLLPTCCCNLNPHTIKFDFRMMRKIEDINNRLLDISAQKDQLNLKEISGGKAKMARERLQETSLVNETAIYGRGKEKEEIVELLLRDDLRSAVGFSVIPITGMGGLGKTTLAQLVYNDGRVKNHFDFKAWACVSDYYDVVRVTNAILQTIDDGAGDGKDLNLLQEKLKSKLHGKKFLLVLDDIWNENPNDWELLCRPFALGSLGSKIIITTRNEGVSSMVATDKVHSLGTLSSDDCLRVFAQHSLQTTDFTAHQHLKEIGEKIVRKCNGLPLAAKTLGGLLRGKDNPDDWDKVLESKIWDLPEEKSDIMRALKVSYYYLPAHLKRCLAYCSLLPKDYGFCEREIVLLWMAEGLLHPNTSTEIEEIGHAYFQELRSRSFFQLSTRDNFLMHDLINDLAQWAAREILVRMEDALETNKQQKIPENLRHLSYIHRAYDGIKRFETIFNAKHLRTFFPIEFSNVCGGYLAYGVIDKLLKLQRLRVLSLRGYRISKLPNSIGDLKYLRHLDLSETEIRALPESTNTLYNLLTLQIENCDRLERLCSDIGNLIKLRHLNNTNVQSLEEMPLGINKLTCLQTLCSFVVGKDSGSGLQELKSLIHLRETLEISKLENVKDAGDAKEAEISGKKNLKVLLLQWNNSNGNSREAELEMQVLDMLKPYQKLEELTIRGYGGTSFPIWLADSSFLNLVLLRFEDCGTCTSLASVGQLPSLKHLFISGMDGIKRMGSEFFGYCCSVPFPLLKTLCFENMQEWEEWIPHGCGQEDEAAFPCLQELRIVECSKLLGRLPEHLPSLERLAILGCEQLAVSLPSLPALCKLEIDRCKEVVWRNKIDLSSLNSISLGDMSSQMLPTGLSTQELPELKELTMHNFEEISYFWQNEIELLQDISSLHRLEISRCPQLFSLVAEEEEDQRQGLPDSTLKYLQLNDCHRLTKLPQALLSLSSLAEMHIQDCNELISFPEVALPSQLRIIKIVGCKSLESLPETWMDKTTSLQSLSINGCRSLRYIARVQLPLSLKQLDIEECINLRNLIYEDQSLGKDEEDISIGSSRCPSLLEHLDIYKCPSLTSIWSKNELPDTLEHLEVRSCPNLTFLSFGGNLPKALKYLHVEECSKLESIAERLESDSLLGTMSIWDCKNLKFLPDCLHRLHHLQKVSIWHCSNLVSFPKGGLSSAKLAELSISRCEKLESLPSYMHYLTSLQHLELLNCPSIVSFPEHGFPCNLTSIVIGDLKIYKRLFDWGFQRLTSLRGLSIFRVCPELVSLPLENRGMMLPASLTRLSIGEFPNLECLSSISQSLASLESLYLYDCPKLKSFPVNGLPASLLYLYIYDCPMLQETLKKNREYLSSSIPRVRIDGIEYTA